MTGKKMSEAAVRAGFTSHGFFDANKLNPRPEVRAMCESNSCGRYNKSWSCPPASGTLDEILEILSRYQSGLLLQITETLEDDFDIDTMSKTEAKVKSSLDVLCKEFENSVAYLPLSAGACTICPDCTYPDKPCRFPDRMIPSMESFGLMVNDICSLAGLPYNYGRGTVTFSCCVLLKTT